MPRDGGVSCLVDGDAAFLLVGGDFRLFLQAADDAVDGGVEVGEVDHLLVVAGGDEGGLVADVGDVGAGEAGCLTCQQFDVEVVGLLDFAQVHVEDGHAVVDVGEVDVYLTVEAPGAQQGLVEDVDAVGGCQAYHAGVAAEAVHLGEELVEGVLALVVRAHVGVASAGAAHGVNLVDEDDARCLLLGLAEEVADTAGAHADKHLHEVRAGHGEEGHVGLACHSLCQQGLAGAGRAY